MAGAGAEKARPLGAFHLERLGQAEDFSGDELRCPLAFIESALLVVIEELPFLVRPGVVFMRVLMLESSSLCSVLSPSRRTQTTKRPTFCTGARSLCVHGAV